MLQPMWHIYDRFCNEIQSASVGFNINKHITTFKHYDAKYAMKYEWNQYSSTLNIEIRHSKLNQLLVFAVNSNQAWYM